MKTTTKILLSIKKQIFIISYSIITYNLYKTLNVSFKKSINCGDWWSNPSRVLFVVVIIRIALWYAWRGVRKQPAGACGVQPAYSHKWMDLHLLSNYLLHSWKGLISSSRRRNCLIGCTLGKAYNSSHTAVSSNSKGTLYISNSTDLG